MKICIPTQTNEGSKAKVCEHFGSAPYFTIYDTEKDDCETIDNFNQHHSHGTCYPMEALGSKNIDAVVCGGMGMRAIQGLNQSGIRIYRAAGVTVEEVIKQYKANKLEEITQGNACAQHGCR